MKWLKCRSNTRVLGIACDCASECILNLLKAFYLGGWQYAIKGIAVVESWMNKSGGNGGGSTVVYSVVGAPKITYMLVTGTWKGGYLHRNGKGWVEMKPRFLAKGVGEIGCALGRERESEGWIILDVCWWRPMRRNSVLDALRVRQFDDIQDEISEMVDCRSEVTEGKLLEVNETKSCVLSAYSRWEM